jgi:sec-independent protein translocase protein TatA
MGPIGLPELGVVLIVVLIIFGPKRLPQMGRSLGAGMREFKDGITGKGDGDGDEPEPRPEITAAQATEEPPAPAPAKDAQGSS